MIRVAMLVTETDPEGVVMDYSIGKGNLAGHSVEEIMQAGVDMLRVMGYSDKTIVELGREVLDGLEERYEH